MIYNITTLCVGDKYIPIKEHWIKRIKEKCKNGSITIINDMNILIKNQLPFEMDYGGYNWAVRLKHNLDILIKTNIPVVMCDMDIIIEKDIEPLVNLPYDIIVSKEIGGSESYPKECSSKLGFGICCGFMIIKPSASDVIKQVFNNMLMKKYKTYDDQINFMNYIVNSEYKIRLEECELDNIKYINRIIKIDKIEICVLDFNIIIRDPMFSEEQYGNHINVGNVGGTDNFIKYFYQPIEELPLTCRCGKKELGDNSICKHIELRKNCSISKNKCKDNYLSFTQNQIDRIKL